MNSEKSMKGFEVLTAVVGGGYGECHLLGYNAGGTYCLHLQGRKTSPEETSMKAGGKLSCWFLASLFFDREDGGNIFFRNVGRLSMDYTALYSGRWYSSNP
jgi:hypothetical protein